MEFSLLDLAQPKRKQGRPPKRPLRVRVKHEFESVRSRLVQTWAPFEDTEVDLGLPYEQLLYKEALGGVIHPSQELAAPTDPSFGLEGGRAVLIGDDRVLTSAHVIERYGLEAGETALFTSPFGEWAGTLIQRCSSDWAIIQAYPGELTAFHPPSRINHDPSAVVSGWVRERPVHAFQVARHHWAVSCSCLPQAQAGWSGSPLVNDSGTVQLILVGKASTKSYADLILFVRVADFEHLKLVAALDRWLPGYGAQEYAKGKNKSRGRGAVRRRVVTFNGNRYERAELSSDDYEQRRSQCWDALGHEPSPRDMYEFLQHQDRLTLLYEGADAFLLAYEGEDGDEDSERYASFPHDDDAYDDAVGGDVDELLHGEVLPTTAAGRKATLRAVRWSLSLGSGHTPLAKKKKGKKPANPPSVQVVVAEAAAPAEFQELPAPFFNPFDELEELSASEDASNPFDDVAAAEDVGDLLTEARLREELAELRPALARVRHMPLVAFVDLAAAMSGLSPKALEPILSKPPLVALQSIHLWIKEDVKGSSALTKPLTHKGRAQEQRAQLLADLTRERDDLRKQCRLRDPVTLNVDEQANYSPHIWDEMLLRKEIAQMKKVIRSIAYQEKELLKAQEKAAALQKTVSAMAAKVADLSQQAVQLDDARDAADF